MAELKNIRHEAFAQGLAKGMSQRLAYRAAFTSSNKWKDETVDSKASVLAKNDKVLARLKELAEESTSEAVMDATKRKEWLTEIILSKEEETKDKLKAVDILNKMDGAYTEKVELNGQLKNPLAKLTDEELKRLVVDD